MRSLEQEVYSGELMDSFWQNSWRQEMGVLLLMDILVFYTNDY